MDYEKIYFNIIENSRRKERSKNDSVYYEKHHIVPLSLGGSNDKNNLVLLTAKEHFLCHLLLTKIYKHKDKKSYIKMVRAFVIMSTTENKSQKGKRILNSKSYEKLKLFIYGPNGILTGENSTFFGKTHSENTKNKIRERQTKNNSMKGKKPWNYGLTTETSEILAKAGVKTSKSKKGNSPVSEETKMKISKKLSGVPKPKFTEEHKRNIAIARSKQIMKPETYIKIAAKTKGVPKEIVCCPHCQKIGGKGSMNRWHFENCRWRNE